MFHIENTSNYDLKKSCMISECNAEMAAKSVQNLKCPNLKCALVSDVIFYETR